MRGQTTTSREGAKQSRNNDVIAVGLSNKPAHRIPSEASFGRVFHMSRGLWAWANVAL